MVGRARGKRLAALGTAAAALIGVLICSTPAFAAEAEDAGAAVVVRGTGSTRPLTKGGSATEFSFRLPQGAACPGDTANGNYLVQSFMVPSTVTPGEVKYDGLGPTPNTYSDWATFRQPFYDTATRAFASAVTAEAVAPGQPGAIVNIPTLSFAVYGPGELPPGRYRVGVACTLLNQPVRFWDTEMVVALAPDDKPAGITWSMADAPASSTDSNGLAGPVAIGGLVVAVVVTGLYARRRLKPRS